MRISYARADTMLDIFLRLLLVLPALVTAAVLALAAHEAGHVLGA